MTRKRISLIVGNYNNAPYLKTFLDSVLNSSILPDECIIVDDCSTDDSLSVLQTFSHHSFIKIILSEINQGHYAVLNRGLEEATGDYIMRCDPDDMIHPERIKLQLAFMDAHPEIDILGSNAIYFLDNADQPINQTNFPETHEDILQMFRKGENGLLHATAFAKASVYQQYRYSPVFPGEDYELFARIIRDGFKFHNLKEALYLVRVHSGSSTSLLKIDQVANIFQFRDAIFGTKTNKIHIWRYFLHLNYYRRYQLQFKSPTRYFWLLLSALLYPSKVVKRVLGG